MGSVSAELTEATDSGPRAAYRPAARRPALSAIRPTKRAAGKRSAAVFGRRPWTRDRSISHLGSNLASGTYEVAAASA